MNPTDFIEISRIILRGMLCDKTNQLWYVYSASEISSFFFMCSVDKFVWQTELLSTFKIEKLELYEDYIKRLDTIADSIVFDWMKWKEKKCLSR